jgi:hypothetical protein
MELLEAAAAAKEGAAAWEYAVFKSDWNPHIVGSNYRQRARLVGDRPVSVSLVSAVPS